VNRGRTDATIFFTGEEEFPTAALSFAKAFSGATRTSGNGDPPRSPSPFFALMRKSARIARGVIRLAGRGPFHDLIRSGGLGSRIPGGEDDTFLPRTGALSVCVGDSDLALDTAGSTA
jgi:hypothetical protein